jgi:zinc finger homeobox protein 2
MTSKKCISLGLKMNGLTGTSVTINAGNGNVNQMNGHKIKSEKNKQSAIGAGFMNQSLAAVENFMKSGLSNSNSFLPMVPNLQNLPKYENYGVMNAALLASFSNPFYSINLNPYHIQNLLKLTGVPNLNSPIDDDTHRTTDDPKSPNEHSNPEDLIEEVNEHEDSKLIMDIRDENMQNLQRNVDTEKENDNSYDSDAQRYEPLNDNHDMSSNRDSYNKSPSPANSIKHEHSGDESRNDSLRCQHCDKVFNHPAEHLQHETVLCSALMMKKHESMMMQLNNDDDGDDRESKISNESNERKVRVRTAISEEQQAILKEFYAINPRPNREDFRNIAQRLMLDARVVQVWFQNNRSRERKQSGVGNNSFKSDSNDEQPLDLSMKREKDAMPESPTTSPRYGVVPTHYGNDGAINLSRKMASFSPMFQPHINVDFLSRQIPSPNEAQPQFSNARYNLPLGLPLERLLQFTPEMARNPLLMMKHDQRSPANSLSPGSSEKRSWKDDESRSFDEAINQQHSYQPPRKMSRIKTEIPPIDTSEFNFVCDLCDKAFRKQSSLARHKYEHSGE